VLGLSLKETCFIQSKKERGKRKKKIKIKLVAIWKKKKKKGACYYISFYTPQVMQLVQCEKKCNFIVIYLTFQYFYFFLHCEKLRSSLTKKGFDLRVDLNLTFKGCKNHLWGRNVNYEGVIMDLLVFLKDF
jgi:hypothetical protein